MSADPLVAYRALVHERPEGIDETVTLDGTREHATALTAAIERLGLDALQQRVRETRRFVADDGITYGAGRPADDGDRVRTDRPPQSAGPWQVDPLPLVIDNDEWTGLERGIKQRAHLLDAVLTDLNDEQRLVRDGTIPGQAIFGHAGWLPQAEGITLPGKHQLVLPATDLARDSEGTWRVYADRAQAPSGAGYAMANRRIIARVMPDLHRASDLSRLRGFFYGVQRAVRQVAPDPHDLPRVVILSPGTLSETAFDQAFQAMLLGFPLVESDDLVSSDGRIWMRTTSGQVPVDVIIRRVDADWCDQLEFRSESRLGLPGMVEAARTGKLSIVNPLSAGLLENPALVPYLPQICRRVLGEDMLLESPNTWWAGEPTHLSHILTHLAGLVIRPIDRVTADNTIRGWDLGPENRERLAAKIADEPWRWTAQDPLTMSTAPVVTDDGLDPRNLVLRTFAVADDEDYLVMPGGLGRLSVERDSANVSSGVGAPSKDVWVLAGDLPSVTREPDSLPELVPSPPVDHAVSLVAPAPRVASDLYWLGRYAERAESAARVLRVADDLVDDHAGRPGSTGHAAMVALLRAVTSITATGPGFVGEGSEDRVAAPLPHLRDLVLDPSTVGSVAYSSRRAVIAAQSLREQLSGDTWLVVSRLEDVLAHAQPEDDLQELLMEVIEAYLALSGIAVESTVRDPAWAFTEAGRRMERAQQTVRLLRHTLAVERSPLVEGAITEAALMAAESVITYRRRLAAGLGPLSAVESAVSLLLGDAINPRSVVFQLTRMAEALDVIGEDDVASEAHAIAEDVAGLEMRELMAEDRAGLYNTLDQLTTRLSQAHLDIEERYFVRKGTQRSVETTQWTDGAPW
ncbi:circularly permuted type 2 ATP-grasp protein [Marihabitans asiaticum]|uniref:Putative circularly permuted ATP-grasp superfamily protein n=1 Tax=Marihabitans asiaticum TaxID=415218 RepID=A0A560WH41_9MICO|nr:circularly permuted type 2 ATP-grasp protein [Marihabitans asiaticum]TWD16880.1 putative circularly permuted ATP-grasp superfamily protein [Marihabitans asiaticum]